MSRLHRYRFLGLLALPLLLVAVLATVLAWSHTTGPPEVQAADDVGITATDQSVVDSAVIDAHDGSVPTDNAVVVNTNQDNGITNYSAIPIVSDGLQQGELYLVTSIGAFLLSGATIAGLGYIAYRRTRQQRRLDVPIAFAILTGLGEITANLKKHFRTMGRVSRASVVSGAQTGWSWATTRTRQAHQTPHGRRLADQ